MPIVKDGLIQNLGFPTVKKILLDLAKYSRTSEIPGWAYSLRQENETDEELIARVIIEASEMALSLHQKLKKEMEQRNQPTLF
ncbi:MAG: hypothetical protein EBZ49_00310 [Proteobacteria bacterium]|nr:hypothetical protein [Pseudomonadota bacterium]